ncbi:hypothetical protein ACOMHN_009724 [Nucella lapillus]
MSISLTKKFVSVVVLGLVVLFIMMTYILSNPAGHSAPTLDKGLKLVHKGHHDLPETRSTVATVTDIKAPPTTPGERTKLAEHVKKTCQQQTLGKQPLSNLNPERFDHILVDDRYKAIYCYIPKVACTNWRRLLLVLSGKVKVKNVLDISGGDVHGRYKRLLPKLSNFNEGERQYRLDNYFKFMFVREPFERLLSAWRNKFQNMNPYFRKNYGQSIVRRFRDSDEVEDGKEKAAVRFEEFLQYIVDPLRTEALNEHWATYHRLCLPCTVQYDFVGKYENLDIDAEHVLQSIHADHVVNFPKRSASYKHNETSSFLTNFYRNISLPLLRRVYRIYKRDFNLFDYSLPDDMQWMFRGDADDSRN